MFRKDRNLKERGMTLIELSIVFAIGAIALAAVMWIYTSTNTSRQTNQAVTDLGVLQSQIRSLYSFSSNYSDLSMETLIDAGVVPQRMIASPTTMVNAFDGPVDIQSDDVDTGSDNAFQIIFDNIPQNACANLAVMDIGSGLHTIQVNSASAYSYADEGEMPPVSTVTGWCTTTNNTITWTFR